MSSPLIVKKFLTGALLALAVTLIAPALASADAPDVTSATGKIISNDASGVVVEISGTWEWFTHHSNCNLDRAGVGMAIDWGDNNGNHVTTLNGDSIDVGVLTATLLNAADNKVHNTSGGVDTGYNCGTFNGDHNLGTFTGLTHKFPAGAAIPQICALSYDVHGKNGIPSGTKETTAGGANHNSDNSAEKNASTPAGNRCFTIVLPNHPSVTTDAGPDVTVGSKLKDTATLAGGSADISGTIEFKLYGPNDATCSNAPIFTTTKTVAGNGTYVSAESQVINTAGTYRWVANYLGDPKNDATTNGCNAANEDVVVGPGSPTVTTNAGPTVQLGNNIHDTATLAGGSNPTGSITFNLYGPNDATCSGAVIFTDTVAVNGNGNYASGEFKPTAAGTYRWIANYSGDANNNATSNACNAANENVNVSSQPAIEIDKTGPASALAGDDVQFTLDVTNPTEVPLHNVAVTDARCNASAPTLDSKHGDASPSTLDQGDLWTYKCSAHTTAGDTSLHNVGNVCADPPAGAQVCDDDPFDVPLRNPKIDIEKSGPATIEAGNTIHYTLDVKNTGDQRFAEASVVVTDAMCDAAPVLSSKNGDASPAFLNPNETWTYVCDKATTTATPSPVHNVATVVGTDEAGDQVTDTDPFDTTLTTKPPPGCTVNCTPSNPNPAIQIVKSGPATATAGDSIPYLLDVTNTGDQPFSEPNLSLSDALCGATPTLSSKNGDQSPTKLNPGETWTYTCSVATTAGQTNVHNVGSVCGLPDSGQTVCDEDDADTVLAQQAVAPILPGVSRLRGPTGCIAARTHVLTVTGSRIARVSFYVDGRYVGTRTKPNRGSAYTLTVRGAKLRRGSHRVTARVTYQAGTNPQTRNLTLAFARCARAVTPKFTG